MAPTAAGRRGCGLAKSAVMKYVAATAASFGGKNELDDHGEVAAAKQTRAQTTTRCGNQPNTP